MSRNRVRVCKSSHRGFIRAGVGVHQHVVFSEVAEQIKRVFALNGSDVVITEAVFFPEDGATGGVAG